jgi:hypothetical protein
MAGINFSGLASAAIRAAVEWYRSAISQVAGGDPNQGQTRNPQEQVIQEARGKRLLKPKSSVQLGKMYLFKYDAKWKDRLPVWDAFPLVIPFRFDKKGFTGLNLHYIPPGARQGILNSLLVHLSDENMNDDTKLDVVYETLKGGHTVMFNNWYEKCVHSYLLDHVESEFLFVSPNDWKHVVILPFERWIYSKKEKNKK